MTAMELIDFVRSESSSRVVKLGPRISVEASDSDNGGRGGFANDTSLNVNEFVIPERIQTRRLVLWELWQDMAKKLFAPGLEEYVHEKCTMRGL